MQSPVSLLAVGVIPSPFVEATGTPIQPCYAQGAEGKVLVNKQRRALHDFIAGTVVVSERRREPVPGAAEQADD